METNAIERWLKETLSADATLTGLVGTRIYNTRRDESAPLPCVIYQMQSPGNDLVLLGAVRVWASPLYQVVGMMEYTPPHGSYGGDLATIANRIDALLHGSSGSNVAGTVWTCVRERPFQMAEVTSGRDFRRLGGLYRIRAR